MATKTYKLKRKISATESEEIKIPASSVDGLSTVATSGSYNDLSNKPTIPDISGKANLSGGNYFNGNQTITNGNLTISCDSSFDNSYMFDAFDDANQGDSIFAIEKTGVDAGAVHFGDGFAKAPILLNGNAGTSGQVMTSQGAGKTPIWSNSPTPSNMVTTDTAQDITDNKTFTTAEPGGPGIGLYYGTMSVIASENHGGGVYWNTPSDNIAADFSVDGNGAHLNLGVDAAADIRLDGNAGTSGQVLTSQGAGNTPIWTTPAKGTVTQVKINGTTKSPNSAGLVDLGTISGGSGVQILTPTNNTITLSSLSAGLYLCNFNYNTTYTIVSRNKTFTIMYTGASYATLIVKTSNTAELSWSDYKGRVFEQYSISDFGVYHTTAYKSYEYWSADSFDFKLFSNNANGELDILVETEAASDQDAVFGVMLRNGEDVFANIGGQIQFKDDVPCGLTVKKCGQSGTITYHYDGSNNNSLSLYKTMTLGVWLYIQISDQTESSLITRCILNGSVTEIV